MTVHGLKAFAIPLVQAMSVTNDATGQTVTDAGVPEPGAGRGPHGPGQALSAQGRIKVPLYGPRGELNGAMLEDGTEIHLPSPEAARLADWLKPGQTLYAEGEGLAGPLGRVIGAQRIGPSQAQAVVVTERPRGPRGPKRGPRPAALGAFDTPPPPAPAGAASHAVPSAPAAEQ